MILTSEYVLLGKIAIWYRYLSWPEMKIAIISRTEIERKRKLLLFPELKLNGNGNWTETEIIHNSRTEIERKRKLFIIQELKLNWNGNYACRTELELKWKLFSELK
jgi:hypothetical protein